MRPKLERQHTVTEVAKLAGASRRTMLWRLRKLHREHGGDWLRRDGRTFKINLSRLRRAHPGLFATQFVTIEDLENIDERVARAEEALASLRVRQNALASAVRDIRRLQAG